jgi:hypothetical protein
MTGLIDSLKSALHSKKASPHSSPAKNPPAQPASKDLPKIPPQAHHGFAPESAQDAHYAAFQAPGATKSMQGEFAGPNVAHPPSSSKVNNNKAYAATGISSVVAGASSSTDNRERAERSALGCIPALSWLTCGAQWSSRSALPGTRCLCTRGCRPTSN